MTVVNPQPTVTASGPTTFCAGGSVTLNASAGFSGYAWSNGSTTQSITVNSSGNYTVTVTQSGCQGVSNTVTVTSAANLNPQITAAQGFNICPGGSTTLDAGSGYTSYSWSSGSTAQTINVSSGGNYTVTVSQGACNGTASASVSVNNIPLAVNISPANPPAICAGDTVTLDAGSGFASYLWSNGATTQTIDAISSNDYSVAVTSSNACTGGDTVSVQVTPTPVPVINPAGTQTICSGESVTLNAGNGFDTYAWNTSDQTQSITVSSAGSYTVTVTLNGCEGEAASAVNVSVTAPPAPSITPSGTQNICQGETLVLNAGSGYSAYVWSNGATSQTITVDSTGTYAVTVTQNSCQGGSANPTTVFVNVKPEAAIDTVRENIDVITDYIIYAKPEAGATYSWFRNGQAIGGSSDTIHVDCVFINANWSFIVSSANGCSDTLATTALVGCVGINDIKSQIQLSLRPNPATDQLNVNYTLEEGAMITMTIEDLSGRTVKQVMNEKRSSGQHGENISLADFASGVYILHVQTESGTANVKFVKQ